MPILETGRLRLRELDEGDDAFILDLLNRPDFLRFIGDRGVRDLGQARAYLREGPMASYARHGHGLYAVERRQDGRPIGLCGLLVRDGLPAPDIGFAFLPAWYGRGYAREAARATLDDARDRLGLERVLAIVSPGNDRSIALLRRLGLHDAGTIRLPGRDEEVLLYSTTEP